MAKGSCFQMKMWGSLALGYHQIVIINYMGCLKFMDETMSIANIANNGTCIAQPRQCFFLICGFHPGLKLKELRAKDRGDLNLGLTCHKNVIDNFNLVPGPYNHLVLSELLNQPTNPHLLSLFMKGQFFHPPSAG